MKRGQPIFNAQRELLNLTSLLAGVGSGAALGLAWQCAVGGRVGFAATFALLCGVSHWLEMRRAARDARIFNTLG